MSLNNLRPPKGAHRAPKRIGRGQGSGQGKTAGRGHKGAKSRSGFKFKRGFEGGQMPLHRRVPKRGFHNLFRVEYAVVNLDTLEANFDAGSVVTPTLFVHGESDLRVPIEQGEQMCTALKKRKVPAMFIRYPDSYHGGWSPWNTVHRYHYEIGWWKKYLSGAETSSER